ncbi:ubiquitin-related domain-containing protein [Hyaloraphidium curvatum]|nr:ubiquitin-related domain-containing protein [Hyaloraphidium curvatum]
MPTDYETLLDFGVPEVRAKKAMKATKNAGLQAALDWLEKNQDNPDIDNPEEPGAAADGDAKDANISAEDHADGVIAQQTAQSLRCADCGKILRDENAAQIHAMKTEHTNFEESTEAIKPLTPEEKAKKLEELKAKLAAKRELKRKEEEEEEKKREKVRRATGQEMAKLQQQMKEREIIKAAEDARREKEAEKRAKEKIKAQIEQDKKDREARLAREKAERAGQAPPTAAPAPKPAAPAASSGNYTEAKIQIRPTDGPPITHTFPADDTLESIYTFVSAQRPGSAFRLATTFPRKVLDGADRSKTLKELGLVPSAALAMV